MHARKTIRGSGREGTNVLFVRHAAGIGSSEGLGLPAICSRRPSQDSTGKGQEEG
jgi:hypothetical protein